VPVAMSAAATDRMSGPSFHFDFGDGSGADGGAVSHIYAAAGTYTVTVSANTLGQGPRQGYALVLTGDFSTVVTAGRTRAVRH